jgi:hypothetical protein
MGGSQSTLSGGEGYSQRAAAAKKFADSILTLFFSKANLKRLLDLHKLDQCSKFVFTTAQDLQTQFQRIQISPALGKKGEILFAPIQDIAPGLLKQNATNAESMRLYADLTHARNENCIHVAYFYVRVFQIYSALALTVINADPTRRRAGVTVQGQGQGPQRAALLGGAYGKGGLYRQGGGAIPQSGPFKPLRDSIKATPLQVILGYLEPVGAFNNTRQTLRLSDKRQGVKGALYITWEYPTASQDAELNLEVKYLKTGSSSESLGRLNVKKDGANVILTIDGPNGSFSQTFTLGVDQVWGFKYDAGEGARDQPAPFYDEVHALFAEDDGQTSVSQSSGTTGQSVGVTGQGTSSATAFEGFDKLKKLFEDTSSGAKEFPKAYCIARAMTLLNPIFANELPDRNQPYYSQICKKVYDFETSEALMPRVGTNAKVNVYLRSLVSLYYDDYKYDKTKKTIKLTQTESGRSELQNLSKEFAALYMMPTAGAETFLAADDDRTSSTMTQFREIGFCAKRDGLIRIERDQKGNEFLNNLQSQVIQPMLAFQEQHTQKVNALLMKMFRVETITPPGGRPEVNLKLTDLVKSRGTEGINTIGKEAHRLLREYYRKSEAFYIKGVIMFEKTPGGWKI